MVTVSLILKIFAPGGERTYQSPLPKPKWLNSKQPFDRLTPRSKQASSERQPVAFSPDFNRALTENTPFFGQSMTDTLGKMRKRFHSMPPVINDHLICGDIFAGPPHDQAQI